MSMKLRSSLIGALSGVMATAIIALLALCGRDLHWQLEAFDHGAAVFYQRTPADEIHFAWADDYYSKILPSFYPNEQPSYTPPPTPAPAMNRL
jgi:hypothetical protein